jgi:hypothetical protein
MKACICSPSRTIEEVEHCSFEFSSQSLSPSLWILLFKCIGNDSRVDR